MLTTRTILIDTCAVCGYPVAESGKASDHCPECGIPHAAGQLGVLAAVESGSLGRTVVLYTGLLIVLPCIYTVEFFVSVAGSEGGGVLRIMSIAAVAGIGTHITFEKWMRFIPGAAAGILAARALFLASFTLLVCSGVARMAQGATGAPMILFTAASLMVLVGFLSLRRALRRAYSLAAIRGFCDARAVAVVAVSVGCSAVTLAASLRWSPPRHTSVLPLLALPLHAYASFLILASSAELRRRWLGTGSVAGVGV